MIDFDELDRIREQRLLDEQDEFNTQPLDPYEFSDYQWDYPDEPIYQESPEYIRARQIYQEREAGNEEVVRALEQQQQMSEGGFWSDVMARWGMTRDNFDLEQEIADAAVLWNDPDRVKTLKNLKKRIDQIYAEGSEYDSSGILGQTAAVASGYVQSFKESLGYGAAGLAAGVGTGPGAIATGLAGLTVGQFVAWSRQGAGKLYYDLTEAGVSHENARKVAAGGGVVYGAIEQLFRAVPGLQQSIFKPLQNYVTRKLTSSVLKAGAKYGANVAGEVSEEALQEGVMNIAYNIGADMQDGIAEDGSPIAKIVDAEILDNMFRAAKESVLPIMILGGGGGAVDLYSARNGNARLKESEAGYKKINPEVTESDFQGMWKEASKARESFDPNNKPATADIYQDILRNRGLEINNQRAEAVRAESAKKDEERAYKRTNYEQAVSNTFRQEGLSVDGYIYGLKRAAEQLGAQDKKDKDGNIVSPAWKEAIEQIYGEDSLVYTDLKARAIVEAEREVQARLKQLKEQNPTIDIEKDKRFLRAVQESVVSDYQNKYGSDILTKADLAKQKSNPKTVDDLLKEALDAQEEALKGKEKAKTPEPQQPAEAKPPEARVEQQAEAAPAPVPDPVLASDQSDFDNIMGPPPPPDFQGGPSVADQLPDVRPEPVRETIGDNTYEQVTTEAGRTGWRRVDPETDALVGRFMFQGKLPDQLNAQREERLNAQADQAPPIGIETPAAPAAPTTPEVVAPAEGTVAPPITNPPDEIDDGEAPSGSVLPPEPPIAPPAQAETPAGMQAPQNVEEASARYQDAISNNPRSQGLKQNVEALWEAIPSLSDGTKDLTSRAYARWREANDELNKHNQSLPEYKAYVEWQERENLVLEEQLEELQPERAKGKRGQPKPYSPMSGKTTFIDWLVDFGKMISRPRWEGKNKKEWVGGEYDSAPERNFLGPFARVIYSSDSTVTPDQMAQAAYDAGLLKEPDVELMWQRIESEIKSYRGWRAEQIGRQKNAKTAAQEGISEDQEALDEIATRQKEADADKIMQVTSPSVSASKVNAYEFNTGDFVYYDQAWYKVEREIDEDAFLDSIELVGPKRIKLDVEDAIDVKGHIKTGETGHALAVDRWGQQQAEAVGEAYVPTYDPVGSAKKALELDKARRSSPPEGFDPTSGEQYVPPKGEDLFEEQKPANVPAAKPPPKPVSRFEEDYRPPVEGSENLFEGGSQEGRPVSDRIMTTKGERLKEDIVAELANPQGKLAELLPEAGANAPVEVALKGTRKVKNSSGQEVEEDYIVGTFKRDGKKQNDGSYNWRRINDKGQQIGPLIRKASDATGVLHEELEREMPNQNRIIAPTKIQQIQAELGINKVEDMEPLLKQAGYNVRRSSRDVVGRKTYSAERAAEQGRREDEVAQEGPSFEEKASQKASEGAGVTDVVELKDSLENMVKLKEAELALSQFGTATSPGLQAAKKQIEDKANSLKKELKENLGEDFGLYKGMTIEELNEKIQDFDERFQSGNQAQTSVTNGQPATQESVVAWLEGLRSIPFAQVTIDKTNSNVVGTIKIGSKTIRIEMADDITTPQGQTARGAVRVGTEADYTIRISKKDGNMSTPNHEIGHIVWDSLTSGQKSVVTKVLGYDVSTREGQEQFVSENMESEESRTALADRILSAGIDQRSVAVRAINQVIRGLNAILGTNIQEIGKGSAISKIEAEELSRGLRDLSVLIQQPGTKAMQERTQGSDFNSDMSKIRRQTNIFEQKNREAKAKEIADARRAMDQEEELLKKYLPDFFEAQLKNKPEWRTKAWLNREWVERRQKLREEEDRFQLASDAPALTFTDFESKFKRGKGWVGPEGKSFIEFHRARKNKGQSFAQSYKSWSEAGFMAAQQMSDQFASELDDVPLEERKKRNEWTIGGRLKESLRGVAREHAGSIRTMARSVGKGFGDWVEQNLHPEVTQTYKIGAEEIIDKAISGVSKFESEKDRQNAAQKTADFMDAWANERSVTTDLNGLLSSPQELAYGEYYHALRLMLNEKSLRGINNGVALMDRDRYWVRDGIKKELSEQEVLNMKNWAMAQINSDSKYAAISNAEDQISELLFPEVNSTYKRTTPRSEWATKDGLLEEEFYTEIHRYTDPDVSAQNRGRVTLLLKNLSSLKKRNENSVKPIIIKDGLEALYGSISSSADYIGNADFATDARRLLGAYLDDDGVTKSDSANLTTFAKKILDTKGSRFFNNLLEGIDQVEGALYNRHAVEERAVGSLMRNLARGALTGPTTVAMQGMAFFIPLMKYDTSTVMSGYSSASRGVSRDFLIEMARNSRFGGAIIHRLAHRLPIEEIQRKSYFGRRTTMDRIGDKIDRVGFFAMRAMDQATVYAHGRIAWEATQRKMPNATQEEKAENFVKEWHDLLQYQITGDPSMKVLAHNRQTGMAPVLHMFRSTINAQYLKIAESYMKVKQSGSKADEQEFIQRVATVGMAMSLYATGVRMGAEWFKDVFAELFGDDEDKKKIQKRKKESKENAYMIATKEVLSNMGQQLPVTSIGSSLVDMLTEYVLLDRRNRERYMAYSAGTRAHPVASAMAATAETVEAIQRYVDAQENYEENSSSKNLKSLNLARRNLYRSTLNFSRYTPASTPIPIWSNFLSIDKALFNVE